MKKGYYNERNWHKSYPTIIIYLIYIIYLRLADKNDHTILIIRCSQCGIYFITKKSNSGRYDILCPFGCRQNNKKTKSRKRSKKYYKKNKEKKKKLNRARSEINNTTTEKPHTLKVDPFSLYIKLFLNSILKIKTQPDEITQLQEKVRSRGLSFYQKLVHHSDYV